jgi:hypothetical protein
MKVVVPAWPALEDERKKILYARIVLDDISNPPRLVCQIRKQGEQGWREYTGNLHIAGRVVQLQEYSRVIDEERAKLQSRVDELEAEVKNLKFKLEDAE